MNIFDLNTYDYVLPPGLVANKSVSKRDESRLMIVDAKLRELNNSFCFNDIVNMLNDRYVIVRNNSKVLPARLIVLKKGSGMMLEMLFVRHVEGNNWEVVCKRAKKAHLGDVFCYTYLGRGYDFRIMDRLENGMRLVDVGMEKDDFVKFLDTVGLVPLPPYIEKDLAVDYKRDYQTTFAKKVGSVAAPTAGFHFSSELDQKLVNRGVQIEEVTLHVGPGTFMPVRDDDIRKHQMHKEWMQIDRELIERLNGYKKQGKKIMAVGTTTARYLETLANDVGLLDSRDGCEVATDLFIYPGYKFKFVDELITNFHLPKSTLLMLVAGFLNDKGEFEKDLDAVSFLKMIYNQAISEKYRFYSFGDAMLIK